MPRYLAILFIAFSSLAAGAACALDAPETSPVLIVSGDIEATNVGEVAKFDRAMLRSLDWVEVRTTTPFTEGVQTFSGPTLASLLEALGVSGGTLRATALDDYAIEIPVADAWQGDVLLAMEHNGKTMRPRDKGPIWIVYPLAEGQELPYVHGVRMIWQLNRLDVRG